MLPTNQGHEAGRHRSVLDSEAARLCDKHSTGPMRVTLAEGGDFKAMVAVLSGQAIVQ